jgi:hypothetical protein
VSLINDTYIYRGDIVGDIIEFPSQGIQFDNLSGEFCLKVSSDNPLLAQGLKETSNDIHTLLKTVNSSCPTFFFKSIGDSIRDNDATLRSAVLKLTDEYNKIITDLVIQIGVLKIEVCKLKYE